MTFKQSITLFMWGYQQHFRRNIERLMNSVLEALGVTSFTAECLLVGTIIPRRQNQNPVCVEPEDSKWDIHLFNDLLNRINVEIKNHPRQRIFYTDKQAMRDKPENIYRDSVHLAVQKEMRAYDSQHCVQSFAGRPAPVKDHYVTTVIQLPNALFERFRPLQESAINYERFLCQASPSFIHAAISKVLAEAHDELLRSDPGGSYSASLRSSDEIIQRAASSFMMTPGIAIRDRDFFEPVFERFNMISSLMYEGAKGVGKLLLAKPEDGTVDFRIRFAKPVPFRQHRWSRKVLQLASSESPLIANCKEILGLGHIAAGINPWESQNIFQIDFLDHYHWRLSCGDEVMLVSKYGIPSLPQERFPRDLLLDTYQRLFPKSCKQDIDRFSELLDTATRQRHGSMLIVAEDAEAEAYRLQGEGTRIEPVELTPDLYRQVSRIDGAVIIDPHGLCHAIGVILDGQTEIRCTPSRGARYNSAVRYVSSSDKSRLAVVVSDDQTVDIIPLPRPRIKRSALENEISKLEAATSENYHQLINYLNDNRFYLDQMQCDRINKALERIEKEPQEAGIIRIIWPEFLPDPDFNESYYKNEDN